ncbi:type 1 fimbria pilin [Raoultella sp. BIGb0399]|uniref:fimbrial protein n=1 Tax=Raoultella lignicola TaxID=3040939 RepID=UPI000FA4E807|nr:type 1 fimbria pilin [Raoultella sp. BIGb0399]
MRIIKWIALLFLLAPGVSLAALCAPPFYSYSVTVATGGITVPRTAEPGTPISEVFGPFYTGNINGYQCNYVSQVYINLNTVLTPSSYSDVYETNVPGVGFKLFKSVGGSQYGVSPSPFITVDFPVCYTTGCYIDGVLPNLYMQFYATSNNVGQGVLSLPKPLAIIATHSNSDRNINIFRHLSISNTITITPEKGCSVTNPNQTVTLLDVKTSALKSNAGRYPGGKDFNIGLSCTPQTKVSMKFEGTTMTGRNDVLANQSTGTDSAGSSVGIQMMYGNNPVTLGQTFLVVNDAKETETLPFKAHYYYNGGDLQLQQGGDVAASATFSFTYQ